MSNDHERRQQRRETRYPSDYSTTELIQKLNETEENITKLQQYATLCRATIDKREGRADNANKLVGRHHPDDNPEMLFLEDEDDQPDTNQQRDPKTSNNSRVITPRQPRPIPFHGTVSDSPFRYSPIADSRLPHDVQKARNQKLNKLIEGNTPEDLQIWLEDTKWFDKGFKVPKLKELKDRSGLTHTTQTIVGNSPRAGRDPRLQTPKRQQQGQATPRNTGFDISPASRSGTSRVSPVYRSHSAHDRDNVPSNRRSRSPCPPSGSGNRKRSNTDSSAPEPDSRRGAVNRRDRERAQNPQPPESPPGRRNQRVSPQPRTPPRPNGRGVGASPGWGVEGCTDGGHGWMSKYEKLPK